MWIIIHLDRLLTGFVSCKIVNMGVNLSLSLQLHSRDLSPSYLSCFHYLMFMIACAMTVWLSCAVHSLWATVCVCLCVYKQFVLSDTLSLGNLLIYYLSNRCHIMLPTLTYTQTYITIKPVHICPYVPKSVVSESPPFTVAFIRASNKLQVIYQCT